MKKIKLFNPTSEDFTVPYDINGDGHALSFTLHAQEIESFAEPVAEHIKKHLAHKIAVGIKGKGTYEDAFLKATKQIECNQ